MSQYVDLTLDRPRRFRLTPSDWRDAARRYPTQNGVPISTTRLSSLVGEADDTALAIVLAIGCRHEDPKITTDKMLEVLDERRARGETYEDMAEAIVAQLRVIGIVRPDSEAVSDGANPTTAASPSSTPSDGLTNPGPSPSSSSG